MITIATPTPHAAEAEIRALRLSGLTDAEIREMAQREHPFWRNLWLDYLAAYPASEIHY